MLILLKRCITALAIPFVFLSSHAVNANSAVVFVGDGMGFTTIAAARIFRLKRANVTV